MTTSSDELQERLLRGENGPYTVSDYMDIPQDGIRFQLMRGWLVREPSPAEIHQRVVGNLHLRLRKQVDVDQLGRVYVAPFDTVLSVKSVLQPDLLFISTDHTSLITKANIQGAPDLVIEVLSGSTARRDRVVKQALYKEAGVTEMWVVESEAHQVCVMSLQEPGCTTARYLGKERVSSPLLGQLDFTVDELYV